MTRAAILVLALLAVGCDAALAPKLEPAPAAAAPETDPALRAHAGDSYSNFVTSAGARYAPEALGLVAIDRARLWRAMANSSPAELMTGGGAEALVFRGCAAEGCIDGLAVVAVDTATGGVFMGVRDVGGADVLARDERMLALIEANAATRRWDGDAPGAPPAPAAEP